jgi:predicted Zn-dependent protease
LTEECDKIYSDYAINGLERVYGDHIRVTLLDQYLNLSGVESRNGGKQYSTDAINAHPLLDELKRQMDIDIILVITQFDISSWEDIQYVFLFGHASFKEGNCVLSVNRLGQENIKSRVEKVAVHEIGHLFGYTHCRYDCVMLFGESVDDVDKTSDDLCVLDKTELEPRIKLSVNYHGYESISGMVIMDMMIALIFLPYLMALFFVILIIFDKYLYISFNYSNALIPSSILTVFFLLFIMDIFWSIMGIILILTFFYLVALDKYQNKNIALDKRKPLRFIGYIFFALLMGILCTVLATTPISNYIPSPGFVIVTALLVLNTFYLLELNNSVLNKISKPDKKQKTRSRYSVTLLTSGAIIIGAAAGVITKNISYVIIIIFIFVKIVLLYKLIRKLRIEKKDTFTKPVT